MSVKLDQRFKPDLAFKKLQYFQLFIAIIIILISGFTILTLISSPPAIVGFASIILAAICLFIAIPSIIWIELYYLSVFYTFTEAEIIIEKGVLWKHKSIVPYNRITNIDMRQGPLSRIFELWNLQVQTAGYHAAPSGGYGVAEAVLQGIRNITEVKDFILGRIERLKPIAVEAGVEAKTPSGDLSRQILEELRRIREVLERKS